jgi:hypothetical protein
MQLQKALTTFSSQILAENQKKKKKLKVSGTSSVQVQEHFTYFWFQVEP